MSYRALDDGTAVREKVTVTNAKKSVVLGVTNKAGRLHLGQDYYVLWRPGKKLRGRFTWCVASIAAGKRAAQSCSTVTLR